ncbi:hypothetical protein [Acerihabitans sp.]|uniref:hypothetical protein n=1 Tax=Acerihabitans sp. TaxID=2811394 RepID=UPI002ED92631
MNKLIIAIFLYIAVLSAFLAASFTFIDFQRKDITHENVIINKFEMKRHWMSYRMYISTNKGFIVTSGLLPLVNYAHFSLREKYETAYLCIEIHDSIDCVKVINADYKKNNDSPNK